MNAQEALHTLEYMDRRGLTPAEAAEEAVSIYLALGAEIKAIEQAQATAKQVVSDLMVELGNDRIETRAGSAMVTKPSVSVTYNTKALDALRASDDALRRILDPHRTEKERPGTLTIRCNGSKV